MEEKILTLNSSLGKKLYENLKWRRNELNISAGDHRDCNYCSLPILLFEIRGRTLRENRVDVEDGKDTVETYHLSCYDNTVFGFIRHSTMMKILKVRRKIRKELYKT